MMTCPLVSVIMPVYNGEKYIEESIKSILSQTYKKWELVITDDGSTDNTNSIIKNYLYDNRIVLSQIPHSGSAKIARDNSVSICKGDLLFALDADDYIDADYIEKIVNAYYKYNVDIVTVRMVLIEDNKNVLSTIPDDSYINRKYSGHEAFGLTLGEWRIGLNGFLAKKNLYSKVALSMIGSSNMNGDEILSRLMLDQSDSVYVSDACYYLRRNISSTTGRFSVRNFDAINTDVILKNYVYKEYPVDNQLKGLIDWQICDHLSSLIHRLFKFGDVLDSSVRKSIINDIYISFSSIDVKVLSKNAVSFYKKQRICILKVYLLSHYMIERGVNETQIFKIFHRLSIFVSSLSKSK